MYKIKQELQKQNLIMLRSVEPARRVGQMNRFDPRLGQVVADDVSRMTRLVRLVEEGATVDYVTVTLEVEIMREKYEEIDENGRE